MGFETAITNFNDTSTMIKSQLGNYKLYLDTYKPIIHQVQLNLNDLNDTYTNIPITVYKSYILNDISDETDTQSYFTDDQLIYNLFNDRSENHTDVKLNWFKSKYEINVIGDSSNGHNGVYKLNKNKAVSDGNVNQYQYIKMSHRQVMNNIMCPHHI